ncbi:MAG: restriction endonuclease subunit S [Weeksellaceae bacterium]
MREGWKAMQLGELITTKKGYAFKSAWYQDKGVPVVRVSDFTDNSISDETIFYIDEELASEHTSVSLKTKDIIVQTVGSWQHNPASIVGKVVRVPKNLNNSLLNQNAVKLIPNGQIEKDFLYYRLKDESFKYHNLNFAQGAANQASITLETIKCFKINLPPLETQKKIASILSGYDDLIENNLKRIKILEEMAQQTYEEWFVRMRFPGHDASRASASLNPATGLPEGWEKVKLKDCCDLVMGQSPKSEFYNDEKLGLPFHQGVKDYGFRFPINTSWSTVGNKKAKPNSILFSVRAPVGRLNVASEEIILGRGLAAINHKKGLNSFVFYQLRKIFFEDNLIGGGAIFASVTKSDVERIEFIYNEELANKFNDFASKIDQQILNLTNQNQRLREARDILLPRLMMGMIEV